MSYNCKPPKYGITDTVYHITPESPKGVVLDCSYLLSVNQWSYLVTFGYKEECWCREIELSPNKVF